MAMSSTPIRPTRPRHHVSASILFSPRELKQYRRWQNLYTTLKPSEQGLLPTAYEYDDFRQWLRKQDSGYFSDAFEDIADHIKPKCSDRINSFSNFPIASLCKHLMHPVATGQLWDRCPVCTIDVHLTYIKTLTRTLQNAVSRPLPGAGTPSEHQEALYGAWLRGKIATLRQLNELESMAAKEEEWSERQKVPRYDDLNTASGALDLYWFETSGFYLHKTRTKRDKTVQFVHDTNFLPGRQPELFLRRSPCYETGKHTTQEEPFKDRHEISEDSEDYSQDSDFVVGGHEHPIKHGQSELCADSNLLGSSFVIWDDGDSDWEDIDSDGSDDDSTRGSYVCLGIGEETEFVVFTND